MDGNWEEFIKQGTADDFKIHIIEYFKHPIHDYLASYNFLMHVRPTKMSEQLLAEDMTRHVILPQLFPYVYELFLPGFAEYLTLPVKPTPTKEEVKCWIKSVRRYSSLKKYLQKELDRLELASEKFALTIKEWKSLLN